MSEPTLIGTPLPHVQLLLAVGRDNFWSVSATDPATSTALTGQLRLSLGDLVLTQTLTAGSASFSVLAADAVSSLLGKPVYVDWLTGSSTIALAHGRVVAA